MFLSLIFTVRQMFLGKHRSGETMALTWAGHACHWQIQCSSSHQLPCWVQGRDTICHFGRSSVLLRITFLDPVFFFTPASNWCRNGTLYARHWQIQCSSSHQLPWRDTVCLPLADSVFLFTPASLSGTVRKDTNASNGCSVLLQHQLPCLVQGRDTVCRFGRFSVLLHLADPVFFFTPASLPGAGTQHCMPFWQI